MNLKQMAAPITVILIASIAAVILQYASLTQPQPPTLKEIQQQLDRDTLLLEYSLGEERSFVWAVTPTSLRSYELPGREQIEKNARRVYERLHPDPPLAKDNGDVR